MSFRTAWQLHGTCTPLILMDKPCHTGVSLSLHTGHGGGSFQTAACGSLLIPLALVWGHGVAARRLAVYRTCPIALYCVIRFLCQSTGLISPQKHTGHDVFLRSGKHKKKPTPGKWKGELSHSPLRAFLRQP